MLGTRTARARECRRHNGHKDATARPAKRADRGANAAAPQKKGAGEKRPICFVSAGGPSRGAQPAPPVAKTGWSQLGPELRVQVASYLDWDADVLALGNADVGLIPHLAAAPGLPVRQRAYRRAIIGARGQGLLAALRTYTPEYCADDRDWLHVDNDESVEVLAAVCALGEGRGPPPCLHVDQDGCAARLVGLPGRVHVDVEASASLLRRRQPAWTVPPGVNCLGFYLEPNVLGRIERGDATLPRVLGRHSFASGHALDQLRISNLDLTRGRIDLSAVMRCGFVELWNIRVGSGNFGLRWPREVTHMRLVRCAFADQSAAFALPDGLETLDVNESPLAQNEADWTLPVTLRALDARLSTFGAHSLPPSLPLAIKRISISTPGLASELREVVFPPSLTELSICEDDRPRPQPKKAKLFKRNWQRALRAQLPGTKVTIL